MYIYNFDNNKQHFYGEKNSSHWISKNGWIMSTIISTVALVVSVVTLLLRLLLI